MTAPEKTGLNAGPLRLTIEGGAVRSIRFDGTEVLRRIDMPIRDADWRTAPTEDITSGIGPGPSYHRAFRTLDGAFLGSFDLTLTASQNEAQLTARLELTAQRDALVNRAGFILLHPLRGVVGTSVEVTHPDGSTSTTTFPEQISPGQPVFDIQALRHQVGPIFVAITMEGDIFEMEDQRNWTDASFKTYCRPLSHPRPFTVPAGKTARQAITLTLTRAAASSLPVVAASTSAVMPEILLSHEPGLCGQPPEALSDLGIAGILLRHDRRIGPLEVPRNLGPITLELLADNAADIAAAQEACAAAGIDPLRVIALPRAYLASHQPEGPWPDGLTPADLIPMLREAFPRSEVGGGMLTNFTEFNRHRTDPLAVDFVTFGTSAIVHAADDASVLETLEALSDVFASARALAADRPLRLGLISIAMRSNPYGASVAANPDQRRLAMAQDDPRQRLAFAAAWTVAAAAAAARGGVASFAPAMTGGPIGLGTEADLWPIFHIVKALAALSGASVVITGGPSSGLISIVGPGGAGLVANLGPEPATYAATELAPFETLILGETP